MGNLLDIGFEHLANRTMKPFMKSFDGSADDVASALSRSPDTNEITLCLRSRPSCIRFDLSLLSSN